MIRRNVWLHHEQSKRPSISSEESISDYEQVRHSVYCIFCLFGLRQELKESPCVSVQLLSDILSRAISLSQELKTVSGLFKPSWLTS